MDTASHLDIVLEHCEMAVRINRSAERSDIVLVSLLYQFVLYGETGSRSFSEYAVVVLPWQRYWSHTALVVWLAPASKLHTEEI